MPVALLELPTKHQVSLAILGEGPVLFAVLMIGAVMPRFGRAVLTQRYIAICGVGTAIWIGTAIAFTIKTRAHPLIFG